MTDLVALVADSLITVRCLVCGRTVDAQRRCSRGGPFIVPKDVSLAEMLNVVSRFPVPDESIREIC